MPADQTSSAAARADVDVAEVAARLRLASTRLARRLRQEATTGHTPSQMSALATIVNHGPMTLGALADHERVAPPSITKVLAKLEADGLVERTTDPTDRRVTHVTATKPGRALVDESRRRKTTWLAARLRELPDEDRAGIAAALAALEHLVQLEDRP